MWTRRRALQLIACLVTIGVGGTAAWLVYSHRFSRAADCSTVRAMIDYNTKEGNRIGAIFDPETGTEAAVSDYQRAADQLSRYASSIHRPDLAAHANQLADDSHRLVALIAKVRSDDTKPGDPLAAPSWVQDYAELTKNWHDEVASLKAACPAG